MTTTIAPPTGESLLECRDITVRFGALAAVDSVSLDIHRGEVLGLIGPNGSGKSTFLNALSGLVDAKGQVSVDGHPIRLGSPGAIVRYKVFRTYQTPQIDIGLTCIENVLIASPDQRLRGVIGCWLRRPTMWKVERKRWEQASDALERVGLLAKVNVRGGNLSYGERRHLEIARALNAKPQMLLMDEPAAGLSSSETERLAALLQDVAADGISLLLVEHKITFIESMCQRIIVLELGRQIASGAPADVWKDPAVARAYLGDVR
jgi:ABC-type branched-subunit amino acid transport system ATPase component